MVVVRNAIKSDTQEIAALEKATFPMPWSEASILHDIEENDIAMVVVAEVDGVFAGYADVWCIAGEGQLNNIAVSKNARGNGIGRKIMSELIEQLKKMNYYEMSLEVRPSNIVAVSLYEKLGFVQAGRREGYYLHNGEDALILKLGLIGEIS